jgi:hypothetical protein
MPPASLSLREKAPYTTADRQASIHHGKQGRHAVNPVADAFAAFFYQYFIKEWKCTLLDGWILIVWPCYFSLLY